MFQHYRGGGVMGWFWHYRGGGGGVMGWFGTTGLGVLERDEDGKN